MGLESPGRIRDDPGAAVLSARDRLAEPVPPVATTRSGLIVAAIGALAALVAGCSSGPARTLNAGSVAGQISAQLATRYHLDAPQVSCPPRVPARPGQVFVCSAVLDGQRVRLDATVTSGSGAFTIEPEEAVLVPASVASQLAERIAARAGTSPAVSCPGGPVVVIALHHSLTCTATFSGQAPRQVVVTVVDRRGDFGFQLLPASG